MNLLLIDNKLKTALLILTGLLQELFNLGVTVFVLNAPQKRLLIAILCFQVSTMAQQHGEAGHVITF